MGDTKTLLERWLKRARESSLAHYGAAERCTRLHYYLGVPATILAAVVSTAVFASLESNQVIDIRIKIAVGMLSIVTAVLTALQTYLGFSERADAHRSAATKYGSVRRLIEQSLNYINNVTPETIDNIRVSLDSIAESSPNVPEHLWRRVISKSDNDYLYANTAKS